MLVAIVGEASVYDFSEKWFECHGVLILMHSVVRRRALEDVFQIFVDSITVPRSLDQ